jgi:murein DD-endopeptidase MepM/ murein hydrolase activator NlpD
MEQDLVGPLLTLLIVVIGIVIIVSGKNSGKALKYLFAPVLWMVGNLFRLAILVVVGVVAFQLFPRALVEEVGSEISRAPSRSNEQFAYPVGAKSSGGLRSGEGWRVSQDFADTFKPVYPELSGQHLGEDWVPIASPAAGAAVYAIAEGTVIRNERNDSFGHVVMIQHEVPGPQHSYVTALYGHIRPDGNLGAKVFGGQKIGVIATSDWNGCNKGCTFTAPGCRPRPGSGRLPTQCHGWEEHLHFELRGSEADPLPGFGYAMHQEGYLNPTDQGSVPQNSGGGWIDQW